jgi:hypothetical protein
MSNDKWTFDFSIIDKLAMINIKQEQSILNSIVGVVGYLEQPRRLVVAKPISLLALSNENKRRYYKYWHSRRQNQIDIRLAKTAIKCLGQSLKAIGLLERVANQVLSELIDSAKKAQKPMMKTSAHKRSKRMQAPKHWMIEKLSGIYNSNAQIHETMLKNNHKSLFLFALSHKSQSDKTNKRSKYQKVNFTQPKWQKSNLPNSHKKSHR